MPEKELDKFDKFINKPVDINSTDYFYYFLSIINGREFGIKLTNEKYSLIEAKFISILNLLSELDDDDYKVDSFIEYISSIKIPRLLEENVTNILNSIDKIEDSYVKRNAFAILIYSIQETDLLEENFTALLNSLERIKDMYEKRNAFDTLMFSIRGTCLLEKNLTAILSILYKIDDNEVKRSAFYTMTPLIGERPLLGEKFTEVLSFLDEFSGWEKIHAFSEIISSIKISDLTEEQKTTQYSLIESKFPDILKTIDKINDDIDKRRAFCYLMWSFKRTYLLEKNFSALLNSVEKIVSKTHKIYSLSYMISAFEGNKVFNEKITLIKEQFPEYMNELDEVLREKKIK